MGITFSLAVILGFVSVVLLLEGLFIYWNDAKSPEVRRLENRLRAISAGGHAKSQAKLLKERVLSQNDGIHRLLLRFPNVKQIDRFLLQAGYKKTFSYLLATCGLLALAFLLSGMLLRWPWFMTLLLALAAGAFPVLRLLSQRDKRLRQIEAQLPDALDLVARSLRVGHAFPSALAMVAEEGQEPIASEFKITSDEITFGITVENALNNLAARVPSPDVRYFVMAAIIQRETGGNLGELLTKLANLVRERFKLFAKVRVLAAEGKMSAWILTGLPFAVGAMLHLTSPTYLSVLFTDSLGLRLVGGALVAMAIGIFAMWRIIKIRV